MQVTVTVREAQDMLTMYLNDRTGIFGPTEVIINSPPAPQPTSIKEERSYEYPEQVMDVVKWASIIGHDDNKKIHWIKVVRALTRMSLSESKYFVESCMQRSQEYTKKAVEKYSTVPVMEQTLSPADIQQGFNKAVAERDVNAGKVQI